MISDFVFVLAFIIIIIILTYPDIDLLGFDFLNRAVNLLSIFEQNIPDFILLGSTILLISSRFARARSNIRTINQRSGELSLSPQSESGAFTNGLNGPYCIAVFVTISVMTIRNRMFSITVTDSYPQCLSWHFVKRLMVRATIASSMCSVLWRSRLIWVAVEILRRSVDENVGHGHVWPYRRTAAR